MKKIDQAVGIMRQIADEEAVITQIGSDSLFVLRKMRSVTLLTLKTSNNWTFEVTCADNGDAEFVRSAIGPDGQDRIGWKVVPLGDLLDAAEQRDFNTEIHQALGSIFPL